SAKSVAVTAAESRAERSSADFGSNARTSWGGQFDLGRAQAVRKSDAVKTVGCPLAVVYCAATMFCSVSNRLTPIPAENDHSRFDSPAVSQPASSTRELFALVASIGDLASVPPSSVIGTLSRVLFAGADSSCCTPA